MNLITNELTKYKSMCEQLSKQCSLLESEVNLMQKLLNSEQTVCKQLYDLCLLYDKTLHSMAVDDNRGHFDHQKAIAKQNQLSINELRDDLTLWRKLNNRFDNALKIDSQFFTSYKTYDTTSGETSAEDNTSLPTTTSETIATNDVILGQMSTTEYCLPTTTTTTPDRPLVRMEVIPKCETLSDEETDTASERTHTEDKPFLFLSEYLSKSYLLNKSGVDSTHSADTCQTQFNPSIDKSIAIDLNSEDSTEKTSSSIIDLTPTKTASKKVIKKKVNSKKKTKSKKTVKTKSKPLSMTIEAIETKTKKSKTKSKTTKAMNSCGKSGLKTGPKSSRSFESRKAIAKLNEKFVKSNKNIVVKGNIYYCKWKGCSYKSDQRANAIRHCWKHTGETPLRCKLCSAGFRDKRDLKAHLMAHNTEKSVPKTSSGIRRARGTGSFICPECEAKFQHRNGVLKHLRHIHGLDMSYIRSKYRMKSMNSSPKSAKVETHSSESDDNDSDNTSATVDTAGAEHAVAKQWDCDYHCCQRSYESKANLKRHQLTIHKKLSKKLFYQSMRNSENDVKYFIPKTTGDNKCQTMAKTKRNSKQDIDKKFVCNYKDCPNSYFSISGLYKHKNKIHKQNHGFVTTAKVGLKSTKGYKSAGRSANAQQNSNKPSLTRQYLCEYADCGARYVWKKNLDKHIKEKHTAGANGVEEQSIAGKDWETTKEDYECTHCDCDFRTPSRRTLVVHYKTHFSADDKPFKCVISGCHSSYGVLAKLKNHVLDRHSELEFIRAMEATGVHYPTWY